MKQIYQMRVPVEAITGAWRFERRGGTAACAYSTPEHLLHYIVKGHCFLEIEGYTHAVAGGDIIYYGAHEEVRSRFPEDLVFYSVAFSGAAFRALPLGGRVLRDQGECEMHFARVEEGFRRREEWLAWEGLLHILARIAECRDDGNDLAPGATRWRRIEEEVRRKRIFHPDIARLCGRFKISHATLLRDCRSATGGTPGMFFRTLRMQEARLLLQASDRNIGEIAADLGYGRIHEFSREFAGVYGYPPSAERKMTASERQR